MSLKAPKTVRNKTYRLYEKDDEPTKDFNQHILNWLRGDLPAGYTKYGSHTAPAAFKSTLAKYEEMYGGLAKLGKKLNARAKHRLLLDILTDIMFTINLSEEVQGRLETTALNVGGFRSASSQSVAKNTGENFVNLILYAVASSLASQDEILVDKGIPPKLRKLLHLQRKVTFPDGSTRTLSIPIEADMTIFSRSNPHKAIIVSAKTRLKEVFHIATMWKLFADMIGDEYCLEKWGLIVDRRAADLDLQYVFATADMVPTGANRSQGGDVERSDPRNLIALDASFLDYVFVSKKGIDHVAFTLNLQTGREALFHTLGCLLDLIDQHFA